MSELNDHIDSIVNGIAFDTRDVHGLRKYIYNQIIDLEEAWGEKQVNEWVEMWVRLGQKGEVVYKADISSTILQWLPKILIQTMYKISELQVEKALQSKERV